MFQRHVNEAGLALIKRWEGLRLKAYKCPGGIWTIGYGHTAGVKEGDTITPDQAEDFLRADLAEAEAAVARQVTVPLTSNQFSALVSFVFNLGAAHFAGSTLLRKLNAGDHAAVPAQLARWVKAGGNTLDGLVRRRTDEATLWVTPDTPDSTSPDMPQALELADPRPRRAVTKTGTGKAGLAGLLGTLAMAAASNADQVLSAATSPTVRTLAESLPWAGGALAALSVVAIALMLFRKSRSESAEAEG